MGGIAVVCGLDVLRPGESGIVIHMDGDEGLLERLRDFGFVPGTAVRCRYSGPGGMVTALECRGSVIALRTRDLKKIQVRFDG